MEGAHAQHLVRVGAWLGDRFAGRADVLLAHGRGGVTGPGAGRTGHAAPHSIRRHATVLGAALLVPADAAAASLRTARWNRRLARRAAFHVMNLDGDSIAHVSPAKGTRMPCLVAGGVVTERSVLLNRRWGGKEKQKLR